MSAIKTEGFSTGGGNPDTAPRPTVHRPFSDGSMTVQTELLTSLLAAHTSSQHHQAVHFPQPMPAAQRTYGYSAPSPLSASIARADQYRTPAFDPTKFGNEHPEPPISIPHPADDLQRRSSSVGKAPSSRSRQGRRSMTDVRPPRGSIARHPAVRPSSQGPHKPMALGVGLDTHLEDEMTDSISPPDFGGTAFGLSIPARRDSLHDGASWGSGSVPSMLPGSFGSLETTDDPVVDSPVTPVKPLVHLVDDSYKKQRRRECHNLVEKRRREHINAKIEELGGLLPEKYNQDALDEDEEEDEGKKNRKKKKGGNVSKAQKDAAHCKGRILSHSVDYILDLRQTVDSQTNRINELENLLLSLGLNSNQGGSENNAVPAPLNSNGNQNMFFWLDANATNHSKEAAFGLQAMRPSPEPERPFSFDYDTNHWPGKVQDHHTVPAGTNRSSNGDVYMSFEPSPLPSTNSHPENRLHSHLDSSGAARSSSHSGSSDIDQVSSIEGFESFERGRPRARERQDSQAELQVGMSGLFSAAREDSGGMRW